MEVDRETETALLIDASVDYLAEIDYLRDKLSNRPTTNIADQDALRAILAELEKVRTAELRFLEDLTPAADYDNNLNRIDAKRRALTEARRTATVNDALGRIVEDLLPLLLIMVEKRQLLGITNFPPEVAMFLRNIWNSPENTFKNDIRYTTLANILENQTPAPPPQQADVPQRSIAVTLFKPDPLRQLNLGYVLPERVIEPQRVQMGQVGFVPQLTYDTREQVWDEADRRRDNSEEHQMFFKRKRGISVAEELDIKAMKYREEMRENRKRLQTARKDGQMLSNFQKHGVISTYAESRPRVFTSSRTTLPQYRHEEWKQTTGLGRPLPPIRTTVL